MVWNSTQKVGYGLSVSKDKNPIDSLYYLSVIAYYKPKGNIEGEYLNNVFDINNL